MQKNCPSLTVNGADPHIASLAQAQTIMEFENEFNCIVVRVDKLTRASRRFL